MTMTKSLFKKVMCRSTFLSSFFILPLLSVFTQRKSGATCFFPKHLLSVFLFYLISFFIIVALVCGTWSLFVPVDPKNHLIVAAPRLKAKYKT